MSIRGPSGPFFVENMDIYFELSHIYPTRLNCDNVKCMETSAEIERKETQHG